MAEALMIALLGTRSSGKTSLTQALRRSLSEADRRVAVVDDPLPFFVAATGRRPQGAEWARLVRQQAFDIDEAALGHDVVLADTTPWLHALEAELEQEDLSLAHLHVSAQSRFALNLLMAHEWAADGDGFDARLRTASRGASLAFSVIAGNPAQRLETALRAVQRARARDSDTPLQTSPRWRWHCERCSDAACERHTLIA